MFGNFLMDNESFSDGYLSIDTSVASTAAEHYAALFRPPKFRFDAQFDAEAMWSVFNERYESSMIPPLPSSPNGHSNNNNNNNSNSAAENNNDRVSFYGFDPSSPTPAQDFPEEEREQPARRTVCI